MINVSNDTLPRHMKDTETITVKFKRQYKRCEFKENARPLAVQKVAIYLLKESDLYILLDTECLDSLHNDQTETETCESNLVEQNPFDSAERLPSNENDTDSSDEMDEEDMRLGVVHFDTM